MIILRLTWLFAILLAVVPAHAKNRALLIGVGDYQDREIRDLQGPTNDLATFRRVLIDRLKFDPLQIQTLRDSEATEARLLAALEELVHATQAGDRVVLYFSGHAWQLPDDDGDERRNGQGDDTLDEALLPYDADWANRRHWVRDDDINRQLSKLAGRRILVVVDACHSGTVTRGEMAGVDDAKIPSWSFPQPTVTRGPVPTPREGDIIDSEGLDMVAFFAVHSHQLAIDDTRSDPAHPHSVFTAALAQGVEGAADSNHDQRIAYEELLEFTRQRTDEYCQKPSWACTTRPAPLLQIAPAKLADNFLSFNQTAPGTSSQAMEAVDALPIKVSGGPAPEGLRHVRQSETGYQLWFDIHGDEARVVSPQGDSVAALDARSAEDWNRLIGKYRLLMALDSRRNPTAPHIAIQLLEGDGKHPVGKTVNFSFDPNSGQRHFLLFNLASNGVLQFLYPLDSYGDSPTVAKVPYDLQIKITPPIGKDHVVAIFCPAAQSGAVSLLRGRDNSDAPEPELLLPLLGKDCQIGRHELFTRLE